MDNFRAKIRMTTEFRTCMVLSIYNCTHTCDFLHGTMRICNHGPREVKAVVHEWLKSMRGLKPLKPPVV